MDSYVLWNRAASYYPLSHFSRGMTDASHGMIMFRDEINARTDGRTSVTRTRRGVNRADGVCSWRGGRHV